jgi:PadR family transcriptional regulator PadR
VNLERFVRPVALSLLARNPNGLHGYLIAQMMAETLGEAPDSTGLYRMLREMEAAGYLESSVAEPADGPARRNYKLTAQGKACLATWGVTLRAYAAQVARIAEICAEQA